MNISLSQKEIEAAIKAYVSGQGIAFNGKALTAIAFVTTRNPFTVTANLVLEAEATTGAATDTVIPGFTDRPADATLQLAVNNAGTITGTGVSSSIDPAPSTIGAAIADVIETTKTADAGVAVDAGQGANEAIDQEKSVPEEAAQAAEPEPAATEEAPAATPASTASLFG